MTAAPAEGGRAVGRAAAVRAALAALGSSGHPGAEIVFALRSPLRAGTLITEGGPSGAAASGKVTTSDGSAVATVAQRSWFIYEDLGPFQQYAHPGRVALVDARTGHVTVSPTLQWPPIIDGQEPAFLQSADAYDGSQYRVFYRPYTSSASLLTHGGAALTRRALDVATGGLDPMLAKQIAGLLAAEHSCTVRLTDTLPGGFYDFARTAPSRGGLYARFEQLGALNSGFKSFLYTSPDASSPVAFVADRIARAGCRDVLLYLAGAGYPGGGAVNIGMELSGGRVRHQDVSLSALRDLIRTHPSVSFKLVIDAPHTTAFGSLARLGNVVLLAIPNAPGGTSFTYLPDVSLGGQLIRNDTNPLRLLQFTDRATFGLSAAIDDKCEVAHAASLAQGGGSTLAYLLARAFARGGPVDFVARAGLESSPTVITRGVNLTPPGCSVVTARPDSYTATKSAPLNVPAATGVLANDSDSASNPLTVDQLNGGSPLAGASAAGAAVRINPDGSFTYDPTVSATLQALGRGQSATDTFTYRANDGHGGTATATVTITVTAAANQAPVVAGIEAAALPNAAGAPPAAITSSLTVADADDPTLAGATVKISSGLTASEDSLAFANQNGITGSYDAAAGVLTLSGASSVANYQTALRSVKYRDSNGLTPTLGTRTISFQVDDGQSANNLSNIASRQITVGPNTAPVGVADTASTDKHTPVTINVLANDSDPDGDPLHVDPASIVFLNPVKAVGAIHGVATLNSDGTITYDPHGAFNYLNQGQSRTDTFYYRASDGFQDSAPVRVTVTITGINDPPVLSGIEQTALSYQAGTAAVPVTSSLAVADPDDASLAGATVKISSGFATGEDTLLFSNQNGITGSWDGGAGVLTLTGTASLASYQTALQSVQYIDSNGTNPSLATRTISFQVDDGHASNNLSNTATRDITVGPNPAPVAQPASASTDKHTATTITPTFSDSDGDTVNIASVDTTGTLGKVTLNQNGTITYDPNGQFPTLNVGQTATDTFTYTVSDGFHNSLPATVTVTITGVNDPPVLSGIESTALSYQAGTPPVAVTSSLAVADPDDTTLQGATVLISSGFAGAEDVLGFANQNGITGSYNSSTGVLTLTGSATLANYQAALQSVTYQDTNGATPTLGTRTISFQVDDGHAANNLSNTATRDITVAPNPAPTAQPASASTDKHTATTITPTFSDSDGDTVHIASVDTTGTVGKVTLNPGGTITYDPNGQFESLNVGQSATDTFTYTVNDGFQNSLPATVTVTINGSNTAPTLSGIESQALSYAAGTAPVAVTSSLAVADPDDTTLQGATVTISSGFVASEDSLAFTNQNGITGSYNSSTGVLTLTGSSSLANYQTALQSVQYSDSNGSSPTLGTRTISFQVDDGHAANNLSNIATRDITVGANPAPVAQPASASTDKHTATTITPTFSDSDGDTVHIASVDTTGTVGKVTLNPGGTITYDPNGQFPALNVGQSATDTFTYTVNDGFQNSLPATVTVTINGVNDPPVLSGIESTALSYRGQDPATTITSSLAVADPDDTNLQSATVAITTNFSAGIDTLGFTNQNGITGSYNSSTGVLTLSGSATLASYQTALRAVTFQSADGSPNPVARTISFAVTDPEGGSSNTATRQITLTPANQPPVPGANSYNAQANTTLAVGTTPSAPLITYTGSVLVNATDPDSPHSALTVVSNGTPGHGSVTINSDGTFTYLPTAGYAGADSFKYTISDNDPTNPKTAVGTVNLNIQGPVIWYVDNSQTAAGDGRSNAPFNTLAAANTAAAAGSVTFVYQGTSPYTGGFTLTANSSLLGQPAGLNENGVQLVAPGGSNPAITNSTGAGINLASGSDVERVDVTSASGDGIAGNSITNATVGTGTSVSGAASGAGLNLTGGVGTVNFGANISGSNQAVLITGRTGGTVNVTGTVNGTGKGIQLQSNSGATIHFTGALSLNTGANTAFSATGGGTVDASDLTSTLTTSSGSDLNVASTTIGSAGLHFQSITNGTGPPVTFAPRAISLVNTGALGGLTVTGTGTTPGSGGTIMNTTSTGSVTQGASDGGIYLNNTNGVSLANMTITGSHANGIYGTNVSGLALKGDSITSNGTSLSANDSGIRIDGLSGTATIDSTTVSLSKENNAGITGGAAPLNLTVTNSTFGPSPTGAGNGNDGLQVISNAGAVTLDAENDTFTGNFADGLAVLGHGAGTLTVTAGKTAGNTVTNNTGAGIDLGSSAAPVANSGTFDIENNTVTGQQGAGINIAHFGGGTWTGHLLSNHVGKSTVPHSGSTAGNGINLVTEGTGALTAEVSSNTVDQVDNGFGIAASSDAGSARLDLTLARNTVNMGPSATEFDGITVNSGTNPGDTSTVCLNAFKQATPAAGSNISIATGVGSVASGMSVTAGAPGTNFVLQGYGGSALDMTAVQNFLIANNTLSGDGGQAFASNPNGFTSGTCTPAPARDHASASTHRGSHRAATHRAAKRRTTTRRSSSHRAANRAAARRLRMIIHKLLAAANGGGQSSHERR